MVLPLCNLLHFEHNDRHHPESNRVAIVRASLSEPHVAAFVKYYMEVGAELTAEVGYVPEAASVYTNNLREAGL